MKALLSKRIIWILLLGLPAFQFGCASGSGIGEQADEFEQKLKRVIKPAMRCSPGQYADALANIEFARLELAQGNVMRAHEHIGIAELATNLAESKGGQPKCEDDTDGDGIMDSRDQCPNRPEDYDRNEDHDGCPEDQDSDGDGILDSLDRCPMEKEDFDGIEDKDGCPETGLDRDGDGIKDELDTCPDKPEDNDLALFGEEFEDKDGCPDLDNDMDGILDVKDQCPFLPEDMDGDADEDGCPDIYRNIVIKEDRIELKQKIYFSTDEATILSRSFAMLDEVARALHDRQAIEVSIEGHTDSQGSDSYNRELSKSRSDSVRKYLMERGIDGGRMVAKGFGEERPIDDNRTTEGRDANRRVEFRIVNR